MSREKLFYESLKTLFIGPKMEGQGGFVNLMMIKEKYYEKLEDVLRHDIDDAIKKYPSFKDELFDLLYLFFSRYVTESGSICYTDNDDVTLFLKTHMFYYVKTDRIFKSMTIEYNGFKFYFDTSSIEYKKNNEKRTIVYELKEIKDDGTVVFNVYYKEGDVTTNIDDILNEIKKQIDGIKKTDLEKIFRMFERRQPEVNFFINKDVRTFLREQFKLWSTQYLWDSDNELVSDRINQLQILKNIVFKIIDFVGKFEDELVRIWNKPKFVRNSNYVITLDRLEQFGDKGIEIIQKLLTHPNMNEQIKEWMELEIIDDDFSKDDIIESDLLDKRVSDKYKFLPIDTKYFKDLEIEILSLFDDLDNSLDGWLIKSENYQTLNTLLPKFRDRIQTIYIDPPFNLGTDKFLYRTNYDDSTWTTLLENRLRLAKNWLNEKGSIFVRCDYNGNWIVRCIMDEIFGKENFRNEITINRKRQSIGTPDKFEVESEYLFLYSKTDDYIRKDLYKPRSLVNIKWTGFLKQEERRPPERIFFGKVLYPPKGQHFSLNQEKVDKLLREHYLRLKCKECNAIYYYDEDESREDFISKVINSKDKFKYMDITNESKVFGVKSLDKCLSCGSDNWKVEYLTSEEEKITDNWKDIPSYEDTFGFKTENSEILLKRVIESTSNEGDLVMDFFLGSGTTVAVAHKLKRRWIGIEMGEYFYSVVLPRMKKVLTYDKSGISREKDVKEKYNEKNAGGFFKYYELEQFDDTLNNTVYTNDDMSITSDKNLYEQYVFMKDDRMFETLETDYRNGNIKVDLNKLYPDIDIVETLSNLTGKWIKNIRGDEVEFEDGSKINIKDLDYKSIKPLIW